MANAKEKNAFTDLSPEELYDLGQRSSEGDLSARETLILAYLPGKTFGLQVFRPRR